VRPVLFAAFLLTAVTVSVAAGSAPVDWKALPYYHDSRLLVTTDGSWEGAAVVKLPPTLRPGRPSLAAFKKLTRNYIWAKTCGAGRERWTFTKEFQVPGAPIEGTLASDRKFSLGYYPAREMPYEFAELRVNGVLIARLLKTAGLPPGKAFSRTEIDGSLSDAARQAFRFGPNTIRIDVGKAELKTGERCTYTDAKRFRYIGVIADLDLQFGGDLRVVPPRTPRRKVTVARGKVLPIHEIVKFVNDGPSAALEGIALIGVSSSEKAYMLGPGLEFKPPFYDCDRVDRTLTCKYREFRAGQQSSIQFYAGSKVNPATGTRVSVQASIIPPAAFTDPKGLNNTQKVEILACAEGTSDPACR
jgi:hypothetical protein